MYDQFSFVSRVNDMYFDVFFCKFLLRFVFVSILRDLFCNLEIYWVSYCVIDKFYYFFFDGVWENIVI